MECILCDRVIEPDQQYIKLVENIQWDAITVYAHMECMLVFKMNNPKMSKAALDKYVEEPEQAQEMSKVDHHMEICETLNNIYERKNHDYGDSFATLRKRRPDTILVRLYDKYLRLETLMDGAEQKVSDESIDDTLLDLANYAIMELVERRIDNGDE